MSKIDQLLLDPKPHDCEALSGALKRYSRVDVGEYRIIYYIEDDKLMIPVVGKRNDNEVYRKATRLLK